MTFLVYKFSNSIQEFIDSFFPTRITNFLYGDRFIKYRDPILIYTPPKTGSSTVKSFLETANIDRPVYKVHYLSERNLAISTAKYNREQKHNPPIIRLSNAIGQQIRNNPDLQWQIITLTREPFSRAISGLFQIIERRHPELIDRHKRVNIKKAVKLLETELTLFDKESNRICCWFDEELKDIFGLNVYQYPFSYQDGYTIIEQSNIRVLIIRLEDLNRCYRQAISSFLDLEVTSQLFSQNASKNKRFAGAYRKCQQKISLPLEVCQNICNTQYLRHFYSPEERKKLIQQYSQN